MMGILSTKFPLTLEKSTKSLALVHLILEGEAHGYSRLVFSPEKYFQEIGNHFVAPRFTGTTPKFQTI